MNKFLISSLFFILLVPFVSFAQVPSSKLELIQQLLKQLEALQQQLALLQQADDENVQTEDIAITSGKIYENYSRRFSDGTGTVREGKFNISFQVSAGEDALYIPVSFGSGSTTGIVYEIEGSSTGELTSTITCKGEEIKISTVGSVPFCKIPAGETADFKVIAKIIGEKDDDFKIIINRINYKIDPNKTRFTGFKTEIETGVIEYR